jgi:uncharacterized membrane protein YhaH (DUF805 family)
MEKVIGQAASESSSYIAKLFQGRMNRRYYLLGVALITLMFVVFSGVSGLIIAFIDNYIADFVGLKEEQVFSILFSTDFLVIFVIFMFYYSAIAARRLHDTNMKKELFFLFLISYVSLLVKLILFILPMWSGGQYPYRKFLLLASQVPAVVVNLLSIFESAGILTGLYMLIWPGSRGENRYGVPVKKMTLNQIFGLS